MIALLVAAALALILSMFGTPLFARFLINKNYGQFIREDGPTSHHTKRGTPTMGGAVIIGAVVIAYFTTHGIKMLFGDATGPSASGLLLLLVAIGMGLVGFSMTTSKSLSSAVLVSPDARRSSGKQLSA